MQRRRALAARSFVAVMAATVLVPIIIFCVAAWQHYRAISQLADERISRSLDIASEQAQKVFQSINVLRSSVGEITHGRSDQTLRLYEAELNMRLKAMVGAIPDVRSVWLFDANGKPLVTSLVFPAPDLNNSDRDYFIAQLDKAMGTYIGTILRPRVGNEIFFSVSTKRYDSSGEFSGVAAAVVSPLPFETFYQRLTRGNSASFAMIRSDGQVLARYPTAITPGIVLSESSGFRRAIAENPKEAHYTTVSEVDGIERRFNVKRLDNLPIYVTSSLDTSEIQTEWIKWAVTQLLLGIPIVSLLFSLEYFAYRRTEDFYSEAARREAAEAGLRQSQKMEAVGQLTGGIAHDFNNLLTIIIGNLESLARQLPEGSKLHQKVTNAVNGAQRAAQLTHRLLAFSRRQPLDPKPVDANELISRASELLARSLGERVEVQTVRSAGLWLTQADPAELEAAVINLAINARDAMPNGGKITIETSNAFLDEKYSQHFDDLLPGQYVLISVSDEGVGMPSDVLDHAFEPFFTTKEPGSGTGLGLSQVYGFAKQSGGHVKIYSEVGTGTTVKLYLPRSHGSKAGTASSQPPALMQGEDESILVVEDDVDVRTYLVELVRELGYAAKSANGGEEAMQIICDKNQKIDLLLTDVVMPGMNGRVLAERALAQRPKLKVLFMTGYSRNAIVHQGRLDPGVSLIQKPISEQDLSVRLRAMLAP